ncbi:MAG: nitrite reductase, copper-containing, partial [Mesorhizobium sp.]
MLTRREALLGSVLTAAAIATIGSAPVIAAAKDVAGLPREKVTLVAPPFVHAHDQVAKGGPKVVEFAMTIEEKPVVIDADGTQLNAMTYNGSIPGPLMV